ncbi:hypothetical protein OIE62_41575 (plasmid) [Streptomyces scopuliridis]|uniref:Uncharacterized protein n=1 Tax=Streptomyces scopuliridis TaxID=452529 RepID=A0ACD4ZZJ6_9ACTN|nr:hypothetical protein [Streptomyces scopuliridis]WSC03459.1 hypothetical protein OG835_41915 [Streptomyces scopuliridis]WSC11397.1 hypothetical protein OIE62_41575 [Streptomyces scopuliridis]
MPSNNCADNIPELRDLLGHDALGHRLANRLVDEGITTREALSGASPDQVLYWHHVGPSGLKRLHEQGLLGEGTGRALIYWESRRPGGPANAIHVDREAGPAGLMQVLEASGALLVAMVRVTSPQVRAHHVFGISDAEGFAAMGIVETLVHTHDLAQGLGLDWHPPADLCSRVLARLFPNVPGSADPWLTSLWATGRAELHGRPRLTTWRWDGTPRA